MEIILNEALNKQIDYKGQKYLSIRDLRFILNEKKTSFNQEDEDDIHWNCSNCKQMYYWGNEADDIKVIKYCPNCGLEVVEFNYHEGYGDK